MVARGHGKGTKGAIAVTGAGWTIGHSGGSLPSYYVWDREHGNCSKGWETGIVQARPRLRSLILGQTSAKYSDE